MRDPLANLPAHLRNFAPAADAHTTPREQRRRDGYGPLPQHAPCPATIFVDSDPFPEGRPTGSIPGGAAYGQMLRRLKGGMVGNGGGCPPMSSRGGFGPKRHWSVRDGAFR